MAPVDWWEGSYHSQPVFLCRRLPAPTQLFSDGGGRSEGEKAFDGSCRRQVSLTHCLTFWRDISAKWQKLFNPGFSLSAVAYHVLPNKKFLIRFATLPDPSFFFINK
ncbi:hypothetical protein TNIN_182711 [Trichonephila inaurata madagascariensis]|uniref:Uncharacterized protein n=1 Tax=Trichonephila inaurata madagascariensis TaxID=2747483 RepID=A0A8X7BMZ0_9ARAC|nr:hypothetical protein TNIN_182711 [Trichonephila inaurata madagascariensis]